MRSSLDLEEGRIYYVHSDVMRCRYRLRHYPRLPNSQQVTTIVAISRHGVECRLQSIKTAAPLSFFLFRDVCP